MDAINTAYTAYSDLNLWIKVQTDDSFALSDIPAILTSRLQYIVENWSTYRPLIEARIEDSFDPSRMLEELTAFDDFVAFSNTQPKSMLLMVSGSSLLSSYYTVVDQMFLTDLPTSQKEQDIIDSEVNRILLFNKNKFLTLRKQLVDGRDAIADTIGATDTTYNSIYNRSPLPQLLSRSIVDLKSCSIFQLGVDTIDSVLANETLINSVAMIDPFAFARANANNPEIDIRSYASGTLIKFNYGETMQLLAQRTMGDPDRWIEIATANGLKPPYIDEVGEKIMLKSSGSGDQIVIPSVNQQGEITKEKVYLNQIVILRSDVENLPDQRVILNIREIPISGDLVLQLNGESDLEKYKPLDNAYIQIFKKSTINSNFFVLIPSNDPLPPKLNKPDPWFLRSKSQDEKNAGVDLLLNTDGDIQFTSSGDIKLAYGVENALQAVKILVSTAENTLVRHSDYGIVDVVGQINSSQERIKETVSESIARQILRDSRFNRLDYLTVEYLGSGPTAPSGYKVSLGVVLAGSDNTVIPISFGLNIPQ